MSFPQRAVSTYDTPGLDRIPAVEPLALLDGVLTILEHYFDPITLAVVVDELDHYLKQAGQAPGRS